MNITSQSSNYMGGMPMMGNKGMMGGNMNNYYNQPPAINGPTGGTSIMALKSAQSAQRAQRGPSYGQTMEGHYPPENMQMRQHTDEEYFTDANNTTEDANLKQIINDINKSIDKEKKTKDNDDTEEDTDNEEEKEDKGEKEEIDDKSDDEKKLFNMIKEPLLLWSVYMLLSQDMIKNLIGAYVNAINPSDDGSVGVVGVALYGVIMVIMYFSLRYILF